MKFFIDTANLEQIRQAHEMGILDGVTTNPTLMSKEGVKGKEQIFDHYRKICAIVDGPVSAEVFATDYDGMVREGEELAAIDPKITVKLPCTKDGIRAVKYFAQKGIATNCTLVFSVGQALLAAKAGATFVSPFIGRLDDISEDGIAVGVGHPHRQDGGRGVEGTGCRHGEERLSRFGKALSIGRFICAERTHGHEATDGQMGQCADALV